jgi:hypothetical protein
VKIGISRQNFEKYSNTKFYEKPSSEVELFRVDGCTDRRTDMTKLIVAFRTFANACKNFQNWKIEEIRQF